MMRILVVYIATDKKLYTIKKTSIFIFDIAGIVITSYTIYLPMSYTVECKCKLVFYLFCLVYKKKTRTRIDNVLLVLN